MNLKCIDSDNGNIAKFQESLPMMKKDGIQGAVQVIGVSAKPEFIPDSKGVHRIWIPTEGRVVINEVFKNRVVDSLRSFAGDLFDPNKTVEIEKLSKVAVGDGGFENAIVTNDPFVPVIPADPAQPPSPQASDTQLYHQLFEKTIDIVDRPTDLQLRSTVTFDKTEANGELTEFGLFTDGPRLFSRRTRRPINKGNDMFLIIRWTILL